MPTSLVSTGVQFPDNTIQITAAAGGSEIIRVARTSNTALTNANKSNLIEITSGTFTQTFNACSSLGNGWFCYLQNSGTGDITLDPNGSETIDGMTSYVMYPSEVRLVQCDGTALRTIILNPFYKQFTTSGTFVKPPGYSAFRGMIWGGGGGARNGQQSGYYGTEYRRHSGGGGGSVPFEKLSSALAATETVVVGAGGLFSTAYFSLDIIGGSSTFLGLVGQGGQFNALGGGTADGITTDTNYNSNLRMQFSNVGVVAINFAGGIANAAETASPNTPPLATYGGAGGTINFGINNSVPNSVKACSSIWGGGAGSINEGLRGNSIFGGRGADATNAAEAPGGGGHFSTTTTTGAGARGEVRIEGVI